MRFLYMWIGIIMLLGFFAVGKAMYQDDNTQDIYNLTNNIKWNSSIFNTTDHVSSSMSNSEISTTRLINVIYIGVDAVAKIAFEVAKWGVEVGFKNPEWNYLWLVKILVIVIILLLALAIFPILPYIIAIIYIIYKAFARLITTLKKRKQERNKLK